MHNDFKKLKTNLALQDDSFNFIISDFGVKLEVAIKKSFMKSNLTKEHSSEGLSVNFKISFRSSIDDQNVYNWISSVQTLPLSTCMTKFWMIFNKKGILVKARKFCHQGFKHYISHLCLYIYIGTQRNLHDKLRFKGLTEWAANFCL